MMKSFAGSTSYICARSAAVGSLLAVLVPFLLLFPGVAVAQDAGVPTEAGVERETASDEAFAPQIVPLRYAGELGAWVPADVLRQMLVAAEEQPRLTVLAAAQKTQLDIRQRRIDELNRSLRASLEVSTNQEVALVEEGKARAAVEAELDAWYRNPLLMLGGGTVVGVILTSVFWSLTE